MNLTAEKYQITEARLPCGAPYVTVTGVYPIDAHATFECGQCFRFDRNAPLSAQLGTDVYEGVAYGRHIRVMTPDLDTLIIEGSTAEDFRSVWLRFFGLDSDYAAIIDAIESRWGTDSRLALAANAGRGIRILRQEPWEALVSFIISQNNNIPRIKSIIRRLCREYGEPLASGDAVEYAFPSPQSLYDAGIDGLFALKTGFRAKYIFDAAEKVLENPDFLADIAQADTFADAEALLSTVKGVGPKVASCTLLFGFGRLEAFPVDVWIRRTAGKYFGGSLPTDADFGALLPYAGIIQQYIFHYERNCSANEI